MSLTVQQLAEMVGGRVIGDREVRIHAARAIGEAQAGEITFLESPRYLNQFHACKASAAVVPAGLTPNGKALIQVDEPLTAFVAIVRHFHGREDPPPHGIDPLASIHASAQVGPDPSIHPFAVIGAETTIGARCRIHSGVSIGRFCRLGDDVTLYPNCVLYDGIIVGSRVMVHANAVLGADGFGFRLQHGRHVKVPQLGHVEIGDDVEIGACTTIDRGTFRATRIGEGTKIDNLVQVGHNCQVGQHNLFVSQAGIAGSSSTGNYVVLAGQAGIADHVQIGAGAVVCAKSGVTRDIPAGQRFFGIPANPEREQKRILLTLEKLPAMRRNLLRILEHLGMKDQ